MLRLRLRLPQGTSSLELDPSTPFNKLLSEVAKAAGVSSEVSLKVGMPPRPLILEGTAPISDAIETMETITVGCTGPSASALSPPTSAKNVAAPPHASKEVIDLLSDDDDDDAPGTRASRSPPAKRARSSVQEDADRALAEQLAREEEQQAGTA